MEPMETIQNGPFAGITIKQMTDGQKIKCQDALDQASMQNPHSLLICSINEQGKIFVSKVIHDHGLECQMLSALTVAVQAQTRKMLGITDHQGLAQTPPSNPGPARSDSSSA